MALSLYVAKVNEKGMELIQHGSAIFPAACYHDDLMVENVPWHWHDELEVATVSEGTAVVEIGAEKYTVRQGEGFFVNAGVLHAAWNKNGAACRFHSVVFHPRLVAGSIDSVFWQKYTHPLLVNPMVKGIYFDGSSQWHQEMIQAIESTWKSCVEERFGYEFEMRAELSRIILQLSSYHPAVVERPTEKALRDSERIKVMLQFIQEHFSNQLSVSSIAAQAMISESECLRCFHSTIKTSPIQYIKQLRIHKAAEQLRSGNEKIIAIGVQCGFQDTSYFIKSFREMMGCTPTEYRRMKKT